MLSLEATCKETDFFISYIVEDFRKRTFISFRHDLLGRSAMTYMQRAMNMRIPRGKRDWKHGQNKLTGNRDLLTENNGLHMEVDMIKKNSEMQSCESSQEI